MYQENILDVVKIAVEYILITVLLVFVIQFIRVRNNYATALNNQYILEEETKTRLEFAKYETGLDQSDISQCLTADMVLEAIRKYRDGEIEIYVDKMKDGNPLLVTAANASSIASSITVSALKDNLDLTAARYHPYIVYDNEDMEGPDYTNKGTEIKGIAFIRY